MRLEESLTKRPGQKAIHFAKGALDSCFHSIWRRGHHQGGKVIGWIGTNGSGWGRVSLKAKEIATLLGCNGSWEAEVERTKMDKGAYMSD